jgi:hypothetical protein
VPCKSTLDAFAVKMNLEMPTYNTINQMQKRLPPFTSSLVFNGVSYIGEAGRNKGKLKYWQHALLFYLFWVSIFFAVNMNLF